MMHAKPTGPNDADTRRIVTAEGEMSRRRRNGLRAQKPTPR
jgi:hypothetical protein